MKLIKSIYGYGYFRILSIHNDLMYHIWIEPRKIDSVYRDKQTTRPCNRAVSIAATIGHRSTPAMKYSIGEAVSLMMNLEIPAQQIDLFIEQTKEMGW